jgi:hypothetical protein
MTQTRKERIEKAALPFLRSGHTIEDSINSATAFIDAIDAIPATEPATARVPDTTTVERERCAAVAKRHLCISGNKFAQDVARSILSEIINPDHVAGSDQKPDHIPDAGQKVELPGKWTESRSTIIRGDGKCVGNAYSPANCGVIVNQHNADMDAAREYWFRAGVEAAAKVSEQNHIGKFQTWTKHQASVTATLICAIPTPALD